MELENILSSIPNNISIVAVSKYMSDDRILQLYEQGQRDFGENKIQNLILRKNKFKDLKINWHFIGNLQKNKINHMINLEPFLWQSCVSFEMASEVEKRLKKPLNSLLEINIANEDSKNGISAQNAYETYIKIKNNCKKINLIGIMSIAANCDDNDKIEQNFKMTYDIFKTLKQHGASICSMGMSNDYKIAIEHGSNMVRLGSILH